MNKRLRLIFIIGFFALMLVRCLAVTYQNIVNPGSENGWDCMGPYAECTIVRVDPQGPSKDLQPGDLILAINGVRVAAHNRLLSYINLLPPGATYSITVRRAGRELTFTIHTVPRTAGFPWQRLVDLAFWLTGLLVFLLKSEDRQARLLALMLGSFSGLLGGGGYLGFFPDWLVLLIALARIVGLWSFPLLLHLFLVFPQESPLLRRWTSLRWWLYAPLIFILSIFGIGRLPGEWAEPIFHWPPINWFLDHGLKYIAYLCVLAYLLAALVSLLMSYRSADVAGKRRLRVVIWGSL
ncbi:MAG: PDZ domain-containing protein, partial [Blastocatellia bacterium]|nr:PDZ domain-containing protein [Blastocatellia bacterium]